MSLINDALKRAHDASKNAPANPNVTIRLQPNEEEHGHNLLVLVGLPLLIVALLLGGGWFYFYGQQGAPKTAALVKSQTSQTASVTPPEVVNPAPAPAASAPAAAVANPPAPVPSETVSNPAPAAPVTPAIVTHPVTAKKTPSTPPPATTTAKAAPTFPPLKLQGIYFRRTNPSAMINNQNVGIGETVDGVQVIAIERMLVTVELEGYKKVLTLQ